MVKSFELRDRERPLTVHGPPGVRQALDLLRPVLGRPRFGLTVRELEPWEEVERDGYRIAAVPVRHRGTAYGYALVEDPRPGRFDAELAAARGVAPGPDFGRLQRGEAVDGVDPAEVVGPARAGRRIVLSGDTAPCQTLLAAAHEADVLVHEATFVDEDLDRARETSHSTARQAAEVARDAGARLLCLTHLSPRSTAGDVRDEARATFANAVVPRDFDVVEVPFPEKGEPVLVREEPVRA
jgi:ribonuclease Z